MPTVVKPAGAQDADEARYRLGDTDQDPLLSQAKNTVLPVEKTYHGVLAQIRAHEELWQMESANLAKGVDAVSNTQFGGAVLSAVGVLANSVDVGKAGAVIAGGAGVWGDRYQLSVQAGNYRTGANAMQCVYKRITAIPEGFWEATFVDDDPAQYGKLRFARSFYANSGSADQSAASKGYDTLKGLFIKIHETVLDIRSRLGDAQRAVKLTTPSGSEIATALKAKQDAEPETKKQSDAMRNGTAHSIRMAGPGTPMAGNPALRTLRIQRFGVLNTPPVSDDKADEAAWKAAALDEETLKQALQLPQDLDTCAKLIGP